MKNTGKKVFVGLSGGVDSSVSALLLKQSGYEVTGVYMKNWSRDLPGMPCPWMDDYQDAKRVAVQLGIPFKMYDFQTQYQQKVVDYMIDEFKAGRTPNPDVMCNQEVKFKLFLNTAIEDGADYVATGHYARVENFAAAHASIAEPATPRSSRRSALSEAPVLTPSAVKHSSLRSSPPSSSPSEQNPQHVARLFMATDFNKDQTYFLYRVTQDALRRTIFPLGELTKPEVRQIAKDNNLITADKKESMGICFVGKVGIKEFLMQYVEPKPGPIIEQHGQVIGEHDGAIFYTIGQRQGLSVGGGLPYYVTGKNMNKNEVYVTTDLQDERLWSDKIKLTGAHWIPGEPKLDQKLAVRTRHRAELIPLVSLQKIDNGQWLAELAKDVRALTPGQSAVFYSEDECLGGGIVI